MENLFQISNMGLAAVPVVLGLVEVFKRLGLQSKFAPLLSIILGVALLVIGGVALQESVLQGIVVGLAASGLWSGGKTVVKSVR